MHDSFADDTRAATDPGVGGPEPGGLSDRQRAFLKLFGALVVVSILALRVGSLWNLAWEAHGVGRGAVERLTAGVDIDFAVLFPFGLVTAWMLLFALDRTKKLQRGLAVAAYLLLLVWIVVIENRWRAEVAWIEFWYAPLVGALVGIVTGVAPQLLRGEHGREFPVAALGLFVTASALCVVAFLDVHLFAVERVPAPTDMFLPSPLSPAGTVIDVLSTAGFVALFGWFLLYSDYRQIAVLSTSQALGLGIMSGLLDHTQQRYEGTSVRMGATLAEAKAPIGRGERPDGVATGTDAHFAFKYIPQNTPRWSYVSATPLKIGDLSPATINGITDHSAQPGRLQRFVLFVADTFLPGRLKQRLASDTGLLADTVLDADALLFVMSIKDFDGYRTGIDPTLGALSPPDDFNRFVELCGALGDSRRRIIVVTDAEAVLGLSQAETIASDEFAGFVAGQLLDVGDEYTVVPVSWSATDDDDDRLVVGIENLRRELDR